jgi:rhamnogalacturonyl hydrolase YesR
LPSDHPALPELAQRFRQVVPQVLEQQNRNGLWNVFTHQPSSGPETSGSAGIAAALARALQLDWLNPSVLSACRRCAQGLQAYIEMDGCLAGVSQHNPASEEALQLDYRIRAAWGTGLYGQLVAALSLL